jgi:16S rRNA A1518/A1519 N6-dimethyltransferase RsmA/KsgA/DIM1 with predicted DNA glycosylase/AP lyase activity
MLRGALADLFGPDTDGVITAAGVSPEARAEDLTVREWAALARAGAEARRR